MPSEEAAPAMSRNAKVSLRSAIIAAIAMMATFAAAALPIPLYADYQATLGLTDSDVSLTTVYYLAGVLVVLFMGGSLSDALGRKPMVAASLAFGALGCALFAVACGIILSASMHMLISYSDPSESASVVSLINFAGYVGTTLLSVAMSGLASALSLAGVLAFIAVLGGLFMIHGTLCGLKMLRK